MLQPFWKTKVLSLLFYCTLAKAIDHATNMPIGTQFSENSKVKSYQSEDEGFQLRNTITLMSSISTVSVTNHHITEPLSTLTQYQSFNQDTSFALPSNDQNHPTTAPIESSKPPDDWGLPSKEIQLAPVPSFTKSYDSIVSTTVIYSTTLNYNQDFPVTTKYLRSSESKFVSKSTVLDSSFTPIESIISRKNDNVKITYTQFDTEAPKARFSSNRYNLASSANGLIFNPTRVISATISISSLANSLLVTTVPPVANEGQYFVAIKSDDCPKIKINKFDHELTRALAALGVLNVTANIARTKCRTQLNVNITATAPQSAIKLLEQSKRRNITITVFNRTFKIIDIQQLNGVAANDTEVLNTTATVITAVQKNEIAYVVVGACFGLVLLVCVTVCCIKCWSKDPNKRLSSLRSSHSPLNAEDYTLTPLPRPTSLYVDYYRNSFSPDMRSTTSAGSISSTSPTGEKVVRPFDTSIVPLEDFVVSTICDDSRRNSVESTSTQKSCNHLPGANPRLLYLNSMAESRERLNPKMNPGTQVTSGGVSNPTYQRY